ncbi:CCR4-Not complex component, Not1-domain-containing protein [Globomyces pollinis-pini]|nr:CCR4-Not complex component, Not1-domain-containing protein [Globomyces pollinis-pini]
MESISLSLYFRDLGYGATYSSQVIFAVLEQLAIYSSNAAKKINVKELAKVLAMMAQTHSGLQGNPTLHSLTYDILDEKSQDQLKQMKTWNVDLFFPMICQMIPSLDWSQVLRSLDDADTKFADSQSLAVVLKATKAVINDMSNFPTNVFLEQWTNRRAQIQFLTRAVQIAPEAFTMSKFVTKTVVSSETFQMNNLNRIFLNSASQSCWNSMELCRILIDYSDASPQSEESSNLLIEIALEQSPDLLLLAFVSLPLPWPKIVKDLGPRLVMAITGHPHSIIVLTKVWEISPSVVLAGLVLLYHTDSNSITRILDIAQELKALEKMLDTKNFLFSIDLAALASRRDYLNLEKWLQDRINAHGDSFIRGCLEFLNENIMATQKARSEGHMGGGLPLDVISVFLRILHSRSSSMSPENAEFREKIFATCAQIYPRENAADDHQPELTSFPKDIEDESNAFYEKIYNGKLSIALVVELLHRLKVSQSPREQEVFKCMIHNLFDEYKFFSRYPERELVITGILFGVLIQNQIVTSMALGIALRYVLEALRQPVGSKLFTFGIQSLAQFQNRLVEWPQYCSLLLQIEHLHQSHPEVFRLITSLQQPMAMEHNNIATPAAPIAAPIDGIVFTSLQLSGVIDEMDMSFSEIPNEAICDKILFIINNLSFSNLDSKVTELADILQPKFARWFCHYIVVKRASIEPNFHSLYIAFLEALGIQKLHSFIIFETLSNIRVIINSEKTLNSSQERSYLKNLGAWLGAITLGKNKPIKHKNLAFKELLIEGFELRRLIVVIPFVCKVLEQCNVSKVFKPPNPWLMAVVGLLVELYHFADLKLNLKFEIEVLCKNIKLDVKDITPSDILRNKLQNLQQRPDRENRLVGVESARQFSEPAPPEDDNGGFPNLANFITFNPSITLFNSQPSLKRIVHIAIERSIREVIQSPVVERSVTIAIVATREIVTKDFSLEANEEKMRKAAQYMVQSLSGSLASVSSREPLKVSMITNLRSLLLANGFSEQTVPEHIIFAIVADNIELACAVMEKAAAEKSIPDIDESLAVSYMNRKKHREQHAGQPFYDPAVFASSRYLSALPEPLRLRQGGLSPMQMRVYEDFTRISQRINSNENAESLNVQRTLPPPDNVVEDLPNPTQSLQQTFDQFILIIEDLQKQLEEAPESTLESLPASHPVKLLLPKLHFLASRAVNQDESCLLFSERIVKLLYTQKSSLARETYILLLKMLVDISKPLLRELKEWFLYYEDDRKYDVEITVDLFRSRILAPTELDMQLARQVETRSDQVIQFTIDLIRELCISQPLYLYTEFQFCIATLQNINHNSDMRDRVSSLIDELENFKTVTSPAQPFSSSKTDSANIKILMERMFKEWIQLYAHPSSNVESQLKFSNLLFEQITKGADSLPIFFRVALEYSLFASTPPKDLQVVESSFLEIDAFAQMLVYFLLHQDDSLDGGRLKLATKCFSYIALILVNVHEKSNINFYQKPLYRLFSSILNELQSNEEELGTSYIEILVVISNVFHTVKPTFLPGFAFSWVQLISHRHFLSPLLTSDNQQHWPVYHRLIVDMLEFLFPLLTQDQMNNVTRVLYRASLRVLLILLHDFPEFLSDYHHSLVDLLPASCIQLRNLILSALPRDMRLPDPLTPNLKVDLLPEINQQPRIRSDINEILQANNIQGDIDNCLKNKVPNSFIKQLVGCMKSKPALGTVSLKYNIPLINAFVLYVGIEAIKQTPSSSPPVMAQSNATDLYQQLLLELDSEGRYLLLSAIANQLRYPNNQTHYFSCVLLHLFAEATSEIVQEQITRVLIERLIASRPHPYGLLITFIELIRNPHYAFWDHSSFISAAPEIENLFQNVAKSMSHAIPQGLPSNS